MTTNNDHIRVEHQPDESRFALFDDAAAAPVKIGEEAYKEFTAGGERQRIFYHTLVSEEYGGRGLAAILVRQAVDESVADGFTIVPVCPYVKKWFEKNADHYAAHQTPVTPDHLNALRG